jgi:AraC-like DNA-binding protein
MNEITHISTVDQISQSLTQTGPQHPHMAIIDFAKVDLCGVSEIRFSSDVYMILLKDHCTASVTYGRQDYDFQSGFLSFFAPNQVISLTPDNTAGASSGYGVFFHPDFIINTPVADKMKSFGFFGYSLSEALHTSDLEQKTLLQCIENMEDELSHGFDKHTEVLTTANLELLLNYCTRYFDRQFYTRKRFQSHILEKFEQLLDDYYQSDAPQIQGLPTVKYFAERIHLSANYLSDHLRTNTGTSAQEYIQRKIISEAKIRLLNQQRTSINQVALDLGFDNPPYFTRLFKKRVGQTPTQFLKDAS